MLPLSFARLEFKVYSLRFAKDHLFSAKFHFALLLLGGKVRRGMYSYTDLYIYPIYSYRQAGSKLSGGEYTIYVCSDLLYLVSALKVT